jgi:beta-N-acetylhexosaminidase
MKNMFLSNGFVRYSSMLFVVFVLFSLPTFAQPEMSEIDALIADMTMEQKVGQMFMVNLHGPNLTVLGRELLETWQPGAVVLMTSNAGTPEQVTLLTNSFQQTVIDSGGIPLFIATDHEGGTVARLHDGFTNWPVPMLLTAAQDNDLAYRVGQGMARELSAVGINMNLAPVADLQTNVDNPVIGSRSPGSDPAMVGQTINGVVRGMQDTGVMAVVKHFPGHGDTSEDSHNTLPTLPHERERLDNVELPPFIAAIEADVMAVMVAHIWFSELDPEQVVASSLSYNVVTGLLREELGFNGIIMTDALDMDAIDTTYTHGEGAVLAIQAGVDMIIAGGQIGEPMEMRAMQAVADAVRNGEIDETRLDESVRRILLAKQRAGVLDWSPLSVETVIERMDVAANSELLDQLFRSGVTLVYDNYDLLPLSVDEYVGIVYPGARHLILTECRQYSDNVRWLGVSNFPTGAEIYEAEILGTIIDKIVVFTWDAYDNTEALVNSLPMEKTVVVALSSPYDWVRFPDIGAYMLTYSFLDPGIVTACDILFGGFSAQGRLSVVLDDDLPAGTYHGQ